MTKTQELAAALTSEILCAYLSRNTVPAADLPNLMGEAFVAMERALSRTVGGDGRVSRPTPEQIRASITEDAITSFEDGKRYRTLTRHLSRHGLTMAEYRAKWGLPDDYPVCAKSFSDLRSAQARNKGLGRPAVVRPLTRAASAQAHDA
jgi:predicted transcriptional regulator